METEGRAGLCDSGSPRSRVDTLKRDAVGGTLQPLDSLNGKRADTLEVHRRAVKRVTRAMRNRLYEGMTLGDMADVAIMSPYHFSRVFREVTGITPSHYFCGLRIEAAKRRLLASSMSVTEICFDVGYNSLGTFTRRFKELVNLPPRDFRALGAAGAERSLDSLRRRVPRFHAWQGDPAVRGSVRAPESFDGPIFVGLFPEPIPEGRPLACTVLAGPGSYSLRPPRPGRYYLLSVGLHSAATVESSLILHDAYRAGSLGTPLEIDEEGWAGETELELRPPSSIDPPIPMALGFLLRERLARRNGSTVPASPASASGAKEGAAP